MDLFHSISACDRSRCESLRRLCTNRCMAWHSLCQFTQLVPFYSNRKKSADKLYIIILMPQYLHVTQGWGSQDLIPTTEFPRDQGSGLVCVSKMTPLLRMILGALLTVLLTFLFTEECYGQTGTVFSNTSSLHVSVLPTVVGHLSSRKLSPLELFSHHYMPL